jgi:hypothetical protein
MDSERWVSDMQGRNFVRSASLSEIDDGPAVDGTVDNVFPLFAPRAGSVAALIAAASAPASSEELAGEDHIRAAFRSVVAEREVPAPRRHRLAPFAIASLSVAGLVAGTAGLSAAAVLPPSANHIVAQVLRHVGIDVAPSTTPEVVHSSSPPVQPTPDVTTPSGPVAGAGIVGSTQPATVTPAHTSTRTHGTTPCVVTAAVSPTVHSSPEIAATSTIQATNAALSQGTPVSIGGQNSCVTKNAHRPAKSGGSGSGTKPGGATNPGSGSGGGGTTRGTNHGKGAGKGKGTGSGTGTGTGGHHGHHGQGGGSGTAGSGSGTGTGSGTGSGTGTGTGTTPTSTVPDAVATTGPTNSPSPLNH